LQQSFGAGEFLCGDLRWLLTRGIWIFGMAGVAPIVMDGWRQKISSRAIGRIESQNSRVADRFTPGILDKVGKLTAF
jgi:hypothetical protein